MLQYPLGLLVHAGRFERWTEPWVFAFIHTFSVFQLESITYRTGVETIGGNEWSFPMANLSDTINQGPYMMIYANFVIAFFGYLYQRFVEDRRKDFGFFNTVGMIGTCYPLACLGFVPFNVLKLAGCYHKGGFALLEEMPVLDVEQMFSRYSQCIVDSPVKERWVLALVWTLAGLISVYAFSHSPIVNVIRLDEAVKEQEVVEKEEDSKEKKGEEEEEPAKCPMDEVRKEKVVVQEEEKFEDEGAFNLSFFVAIVYHSLFLYLIQLVDYPSYEAYTDTFFLWLVMCMWTLGMMVLLRGRRYI